MVLPISDAGSNNGCSRWRLRGPLYPPALLTAQKQEEEELPPSGPRELSRENRRLSRKYCMEIMRRAALGVMCMKHKHQTRLLQDSKCCWTYSYHSQSFHILSLIHI